MMYPSVYTLCIRSYWCQISPQISKSSPCSSRVSGSGRATKAFSVKSVQLCERGDVRRGAGEDGVPITLCLCSHPASFPSFSACLQSSHRAAWIKNGARVFKSSFISLLNVSSNYYSMMASLSQWQVISCVPNINFNVVRQLQTHHSDSWVLIDYFVSCQVQGL